MTEALAIALAQINPTVGAIDANLAQIRAVRAEAAVESVDLVICSELVVTGYPPEDLVLKPMLQDAARSAVQQLAAETADGGPALLIGAPWREDDKLFNAALLLAEGHIVERRDKHDLPNYGVFDEKRVFDPGPLPGPIPFKGVRFGVMICEDMWTAEVTECLDECGADILVVLNGSPYESDKGDVRLNLAIARITEAHLPLIYVNQIGGQDELVFDGTSFVLNADCTLAVQLPPWVAACRVTRWSADGDRGWACESGETAASPDGLESVYRAMVLGLHDYVEKNGFSGVLVGMSGGVDSALSAVVAADALGPDRVHCVMMPSVYTSDMSRDDAAECANLLGAVIDSVPIGSALAAYDEMLAELFAGRDADETEENLQARVRGMILMALSNKFGSMVLSTGNKSEMSVGYATLYGDMCGGYSVLKDVYKTTVYALCHWRNQNRPDGLLGPEGRVIPERILTRPPSAELRADQTDQDTLPPYDELDDILRCLIEEEMPVADIVARGHALETVDRVWHMLDRAEYKRRQAPPGVKLTRRSFGRDRRYPITNRFRGFE